MAAVATTSDSSLGTGEILVVDQKTMIEKQVATDKNGQSTRPEPIQDNVRNSDQSTFGNRNSVQFIARTSNQPIVAIEAKQSISKNEMQDAVGHAILQNEIPVVVGHATLRDETPIIEQAETPTIVGFKIDHVPIAQNTQVNEPIQGYRVDTKTISQPVSTFSHFPQSASDLSSSVSSAHVSNYRQPVRAQSSQRIRSNPTTQTVFKGMNLAQWIVSTCC